MKIKLIPLFTLIIVVAIVYGATLQHQFLDWDDTTHISENLLMNKPTVSSVIQFWRDDFFNLYIPVTYTIWSVVAKISLLASHRLDATYFHAANVIFHAINGALLLAILSKILSLFVGLSTSDPANNRRLTLAATLGTGVFLLHPSQAETVAWISSFRDILATFFALAAIFIILTGVTESSKKKVKKNILSTPTLLSWRFAAATTLYLMAVLSKPTMVILPIIVWILFYFILKLSPRKIFWLILPWTIIAIPITIFTKQLQSNEIMNFVTPLLLRPVVALDALGFYLQKFIIPLNLAPDYGRSPEFYLHSSAKYWSWLPAVFFLALLWKFRLNQRQIVGGFLIFIAGLAPLLGIIPFSFQGFSTVSDHYMYFPMIGLAMVVAFLTILISSQRWQWATMVFLIPLAASSFSLSQKWKNNATFYQFVIDRNPNSYMGHNGLAKTYTAAGKYKLALVHNQKALTIRPGNPVSLNNVGHIYLEMKRYDQVINHYNDVFKHHSASGNNHPVFSLMHTNMAVALIYSHRDKEAHQHLDLAIKLDATNALAWHNKGAIYLMHRKYAKSLPYLKKSVDLAPYIGLHRKNYQMALSLLRNEK